MDFITTLCILFVLYSFIGWAEEVILGLIQHGKLINRGFLIGPICPIYGFGSIFMTLTLTQFKSHPVAVFVLAVVACSVLEYITSYIMEKLFNNRWWDYSEMKYNLNGRICLECALAFGFAALLMLYIINPVMIPLVNEITINIKYIIILVILLIAIVDVSISFGVIVNLKNISNNIRSDSTEIISKKVKEILLTKNIVYKRLRSAFPDMQIKNTRAILKEKLDKQKEKLKMQKEKLIKMQKEFSEENKILAKMQKKKVSKK